MRGTWQRSPPTIGKERRSLSDTSLCSLSDTSLCSLSDTSLCSLGDASLDPLVLRIERRGCRCNARALLSGLVLLPAAERCADHCHVQECRHIILAKACLLICVRILRPRHLRA